MARDPTGLTAEANAFRYCPLARVVLCRGSGVTDALMACARAAAAAVGVDVQELSEAAVVEQAGDPGVDKVRFLGLVADSTRLAALDAGLVGG